MAEHRQQRVDNPQTPAKHFKLAAPRRAQRLYLVSQLAFVINDPGWNGLHCDLGAERVDQSSIRLMDARWR
jgi:hypothetical protein